MLMPSTAWDVYRKRDADSLQLRAGKPSSLGVNVGWVALADKAPLIDAVNRVLRARPICKPGRKQRCCSACRPRSRRWSAR